METMRYILVETRENDCNDDGPTMKVLAPRFYATEEEVICAIMVIETKDGADWDLFEVVNGKCEPRGIIRKSGWKPSIYDGSSIHA